MYVQCFNHSNKQQSKQIVGEHNGALSSHKQTHSNNFFCNFFRGGAVMT